MKKWKTALWLLVVAVAISAAALVGVRIGIDMGRAQYHNTYVRQIQLLASELVRETNKEDFGNSRFLSLKVQALALAAGNDAKVYKILEAEDFADIEDSGIFVATSCYGPGPNPHLRLTVNIFNEGSFLIDGVEFSEAQIAVLAKEFTAHDEHARLHLRARKDVSTATIKKAVTAAAEGGLTDVIFGVIHDDEAK